MIFLNADSRLICNNTNDNYDNYYPRIQRYNAVAFRGSFVEKDGDVSG